MNGIHRLILKTRWKRVVEVVFSAIPSHFPVSANGFNRWHCTFEGALGLIMNLPLLFCRFVALIFLLFRSRHGFLIFPNITL